MAPFPQADHCIASDPKAEALYISYGGMFTALRGTKYLLKAHAVSVSGGPAVANAYELPHAPGAASLWAVMLGGNQSSAALTVAHLPSGEPKFEVLHPGKEHAWAALPAGVVKRAEDGAAELVAVPLRQGCAMVRVAPPA